MMLKYKEFCQMLEGILFEGEKSKPIGWHTKLKEAYISLFGDNQYFIKPSSKNKNEILRADFVLGKIGESEDNLINFLSIAAKLREDQYEVDEVGVGESGSGSFPGFLIKFNENIDWFGKSLNANEEYKIINAKKIVNLGGELTSALIGDKQTTPDSLELNGYWPNKVSIQQGAIGKIREKINNLDCQNFMIDLVDVICKYKGDLNDAAQTMEYTSKDFKVNIDLNKYIGKIDDQSIKNIQKDFGEVLGGIFMFSLVKGFTRGLEFPNESNTELVDFYFDGLSVSSKAGKKGAKSSSSGYNTAIENHCKTANYTLNPKEQLVKNILDIITNEEKEAKNTEYLTTANSSGIFTGCVRLFDKFLSSGNNRWLYFRQFCDTPIAQLNRDSLIKVFIKMKTDGRLHEFIHDFLNASRFKENDKDSKGREAILTNQLIKARDENSCSSVFDIIMKEKLEGKILVGLILYYCSVDLKEIINKKYIKDLSELVNKSVKVNQLYLEIKIKTNSLTFTIKPMTSNDFEFGNLNGISTWSTKMIPISMK